MPTGYTSAVKDGTITEFSKFAMQCARAMGATVTMRDEPHDKEIPEVFMPSPYYLERVAEVEGKIEHLKSLSDRERQDVYESNCAKKKEQHLIYRGVQAEEKERYEAMLEKVRAWEPPTADHEGLKTFMVDQLVSSIDFDCSSYPLSLPEFKSRDDEMNDLLKELADAKARYAEEIERVSSRNRWLRELRKSLGL